MRKKAAENGFSLIEMTIALIVIMSIAVPLAIQYQAWATQKKVDDTKQRAEQISSAISQFYQENRFLPCPADPTITPGGANYGASADCSGAGIKSGSVPFKRIGLQENVINDGWGRKFTYMVTKVLANTADSTAPGIINRTYVDYIDTNDDDLYDTFVTYSSLFPEDRKAPPEVYVKPLQAVLISHGETGAGGYLATTGALYAPCPDIADAQDGNNCDGEGDTFIISNEGSSGLNNRDTGATNNFFDDYVFPLSSENNQIWREPKGSENILSTVTRLGINTPDPMGEIENDPSVDTDNIPALVKGYVNKEPLKDSEGNIVYEPGIDVNGNVQVDQATLAGQYCDLAGKNASDPVCFEVQSIAGDGIKCDDFGKQPMTGIAKNNAQCALVSPLKTTENCDPDHYVIGFKPDGGILCN